MKTVVVFRTGPLGTWREKFTGIAAFAKTVDWQLQPIDARTSKPDIKKIIDFWKPQGFVLDASGAPDMFDGTDFGGIPTVAMNPASNMRPALPSVMSDSREIAKLAMAELTQGNPASILFVEWLNPTIGWSMAKRDIAREIASMHGVAFHVVTPQVDDDWQTTLVEKIAKSLRTVPKPCGIFAITDVIGAVAIAAAAKVAAKVPEEVPVVSVDDDPEICENCSPTLTSVRPDFHKLGFSAGQLLARAMENPRLPPERIAVSPLGLVRRASTLSTRIYDKKVKDALEQIRLHACEGIAPKDVAANFGTSRHMAEIRFKAATGKTIGDALLERRLDMACEYLKDGRSSVSAIANFCGWTGDIAFRKAFKSRYKVSPLQWRQATARQVSALSQQ